VRSEVGLLLELFHEETVRPSIHPPVDIAEVVSGLIVAQLGELGGEPPVRRAVESHQKPLDHLSGEQLESAQTRERRRVEEVGAASTGRGHGSRKLDTAADGRYA